MRCASDDGQKVTDSWLFVKRDKILAAQAVHLAR